MVQTSCIYGNLVQKELELKSHDMTILMKGGLPQLL